MVDLPDGKVVCITLMPLLVSARTSEAVRALIIFSSLSHVSGGWLSQVEQLYSFFILHTGTTARFGYLYTVFYYTYPRYDSSVEHFCSVSFGNTRRKPFALPKAISLPRTT